jgi:hypothetical protein
MIENQTDAPDDIASATLWRKNGWIARVIKNEDDDGWAVEMTRVGDAEPALVGPWTMGRDKKSPKPLDPSAFLVLVKTANDILRRHENHARALLHKSFAFARANGQRVRADLDVAPDEDDPHAVLTCVDDVTGEPLRSGRVSPGFKLTAARLEKFLETGEG